MSVVRFLVVALLLGAGVAAVTGYVSRTDPAVRAGGSARSTDPDLGSTFTEEQVARHGAFRGPLYLAYVLGLALEVAVLLMLARGPLARLLDGVQGWPGGWGVKAMVAAAAIAVALALVSLPLALVRYSMGHAWGLSTQPVASWIRDQAVGLGIGMVLATVAAVAFFAVVRWQPRSWWLTGWIVFSLLNLLLVFLWPVLIAPLFNRFTPLPPGSLRDRVVSLAEEAGVPVGDVLVADASKRTTTENAYVAGLFGSKRLVLYDTLLDKGEDETAFIVAHELGHQSENHILRGVLWSTLGLFAGFGVLKLLAGTSIWSWAGASGISDLRAIPLLLLFALAGGTLALPVENLISRSQEATADRVAIDLTGDPDTAVRVFRRLAFANLADLDPHPAAVAILFSHPPIPERIRALMAEAERTP